MSLGPTALFCNYKLTTSSGKHLEDISHTHFVSSMYKLLTSAKDANDLSIGFDRDHNKRQRELTNTKNIKARYHVQIMLKDIFGFAEHQEKATYELGYKSTLPSNIDNAVLNKDNAINIGKIKISAFDWYVPHFTPSMSKQEIFSNPIFLKNYLQNYNM